MDPQPSHPQKSRILSPRTIITKREVSSVACFLSLLIISVIFLSVENPFQTTTSSLVGFLSHVLPRTGDSSLSPKALLSSAGVCDFSYGKWVWDPSYPLGSYTEECQFLDPGFRCRRNGRKDHDYRNWRWQPHGCDLPRFNATDLLHSSRNKRIVFAGDSIGRNQWESMLCMLAQGVTNQSTIYEEFGKPINKHRGFLSMRFQEYNLTVEYYRVPFLVTPGRPPKTASKKVRGAIKVDTMHWYSSKWTTADVLVLSAGHWWNIYKTIHMGFYFQEGDAVNMSMGVTEAFRKSLQTVKTWIIQNLDPEKTRVLFRSYSPVHYRNGTWKKGGNCDTNTAPETEYSSVKVESETCSNTLIGEVVRQMESSERNVGLLNISYMTEFRIDGHPSKYREPGTPPNAPQDCSHWCLPGVPDTWNELVYAELLLNSLRTKL